MDLLDIAILALRIALVVALYAFLVVVLRLSARGLVPALPRVATPGNADSLRLIVVEGGRSSLAAGQIIDVASGATLGRTIDADVVLADPSVSANHARLSRTGRGWTVSDLGSTNGTMVNDARVDEPMRLAHGDVLGLGSVRLEVLAR